MVIQIPIGFHFQSATEYHEQFLSLSGQILSIYTPSDSEHCYSYIASHPGLLTPVFVTYSTNVGESAPGKTESHAMTYLDVWMSGTFP